MTPPAKDSRIKGWAVASAGLSLSLAAIQSHDPVIGVTAYLFPGGYNQLIGERVKWLLPRI